MKNELIKKVGTGIVAGTMALGTIFGAYGQTNPNKVTWAEEGKAPVKVESQEAFNYLEKAVDVLHGLHVNKFITYSNGKSSVTYNAPGYIDPKKIPNFNKQIQELADMADQEGDDNGVASASEAKNVCWDAYDWGYNHQKELGSVQWAQ